MEPDPITDEEAHRRLRASGCTADQVELLVRLYEALRAEGAEPGRALAKTLLTAMRPAMQRIAVERMRKLLGVVAPGRRDA